MASKVFCLLLAAFWSITIPVLLINLRPNKQGIRVDTGLELTSERRLGHNYEFDSINNGLNEVQNGTQKPQPQPRQLASATACPKDFKLHKPKFWSISREDVALYEHYFSKPLMCNGTFLEIGALDGIRASNTLFFETYLGWRGVLIEAHPFNAKQLMQNRNKSSANFAMAVCEEGVGHVQFQGDSAVGGILSELTSKHKQRWIKKKHSVFNVACKPLSWMLQKANVKHIDLFSLDVEGGEYSVLKTMDWSIPVRLFVVEMHDGDAEAKDNLVRKLLSQHGYVKAKWNIRSYCKKPTKKFYCAKNEVWENRNFPSLPLVQ